MSGFNSCIDDYTDMPIRLDYPHHEIHEGNSYVVVYSGLKDNAGLIEVRLQTGTTIQANLQLEVECALAATVELFINTTKTHNVTNAIVPLNRNGNSANTSTLTVCHTPDGSQAGSGNLLQYVGSANAGGFSTVGGRTSGRNEFVLEENTAYLIRATSRANGNALTIFLDWYEHTPKNI